MRRELARRGRRHKIRMKTSAAIGALAALLWPLVAQNRIGDKRFSLNGTIVDGVSGRPFPDVELSLSTDKWAPAGEPVISDAQGRFLFRGLSPGEYILTAHGFAFGDVYYHELPDPGYVPTVRLGPEQEVKSIVFRVMPRATIEGVVRDEFGEPVERANVLLLRPVWNGGRAVFHQSSQKFTDDRGHYRFGNLAPGGYVVCSMGSPGSSTPAPVAGTVDFAARPEARFYTRTCYPNVTSTAGAPNRLAPGQHGQIDITMLSAPAVSVQGRVRNAPPRTGFGVMLMAEDVFEGARQYPNAFVDPSQGTFGFRGVPAGRYRLEASVMTPVEGQQVQLKAAMQVDVGGSDIDGLELTLEPGSTVTAMLHGMAENHIEPNDVQLTLRQKESSNGMHGPNKADDGSISFGPLAAGTYWLVTRTEGRVCVQSAKLGDRDVLDSPFTVGAGADVRLDVNVSRDCGGIQLRAVSNGEPVPSAKVVLLLSGTPKDPGDLIEDYTNDQGEYTFTGLTPGRYLLWTWSVDEAGAYLGPASLAEVQQRATAVEVKAGEPAAIDVPLLNREGDGK